MCVCVGALSDSVIVCEWVSECVSESVSEWVIDWVSECVSDIVSECGRGVDRQSEWVGASVECECVS
jgi:hypothetical protein